jgi:hypothetical protein
MRSLHSKAPGHLPCVDFLGILHEAKAVERAWSDEQRKHVPCRTLVLADYQTGQLVKLQLRQEPSRITLQAVTEQGLAGKQETDAMSQVSKELKMYRAEQPRIIACLDMQLTDDGNEVLLCMTERSKLNFDPADSMSMCAAHWYR